MGFTHNWKAYKATTDIKTNFFSSNNIISKMLVLQKYNLDMSTEYTSEYGEFILEGTNQYPEDIEHIYNILIEDYGLFEYRNYRDDKGNLYKCDSIDDYLEYRNNGQSIFISSFNESNLGEPLLKYDNDKKEIFLKVKLEGGQSDLYLIDEYEFSIVSTIHVVNNNVPYSENLLLKGWDLYYDNKWDLSLLVFYSAIDNFITLEIEKLQNNYYKEIELLGLEFRKKVSLVLKESVAISKNGKQKFATLDFIEKKISDLYKLRNNVAHGTKRDITKIDCQDCFELYLFIFTIIKYKSKDLTQLLKDIKTMLS